ncbi:MAG TPA: DUF2304 domain-containing protein [Polyangiaceae bacterium]|nr:DUF2304 domain-containing protein [Polyangiaceae bacterium]
MSFQLYQAVALVMSLVATCFVVELIRRRKIQDVLWLPWLAAALLPAVLGIWIRPWAEIAHWLGIVYEPLFLVALASLVSFGMLLHLTVVVSTLIRKNLKLAQQVALLREELERATSGASSAPTNSIGSLS